MCLYLMCLYLMCLPLMLPLYSTHIPRNDPHVPLMITCSPICPPFRALPLLLPEPHSYNCSFLQPPQAFIIIATPLQGSQQPSYLKAPRCLHKGHAYRGGIRMPEMEPWPCA